MHKLEMTTHELSMEITYSKGVLLLDDEKLLNFMKQLRNLRASCTLTTFAVEEDPTGSKNYNYQFTVAGGRSWNQILKMTGQEVEMNFDVSDFWKLSEIILHRPIRDEVLALISQYGVTEITVTWQ